MKLVIISPTKREEHEVVWIEINTPEGNFVIQNGHASTTFVLSAKQDIIFCFKTGKQTTITPDQGGILEITVQSAMALLEV